MAKEKRFYNYWELPDWDKTKVFISHRFMHNNKERLLIIDGNDEYIIVVPRKAGWEFVKTGDYIWITKHKTTEKRAILGFTKVDPNP